MAMSRHRLKRSTCTLPALLTGLALLLCSATLAAKELLIATSSSIPPYVISDQHRGIAVEILQEALAHSGHQVEFVYAPNLRVERLLKEHQVDGVFNLAYDAIPNVYYSLPVIDYHNIAITLASYPGKIAQLSDLDGVRLTLFQNSAKFLGEDFGQLLERNPQFHEVSSQLSQLKVLFRGRTDVIIMEKRIFEFFYNELLASGEIGGDYRIHEIFPIASRYAAFTEKSLRDEFNEGFKKLEQSGRKEAIIRRYLSTNLSTKETVASP